MIAYFNGKYLPHEEIAISPLDRGFIFGDALYDVARAYGGVFLRLDEHLSRLERGAREMRFPKTDFTELKEVAAELIRRNGLETGSATLYIQVTRGVAPRSHGFPPEGTPPTVYVSLTPIESDVQAQEEGIRVVTVPDERWVRRDIKSTNRLANVLASQIAREAGAGEALFVQEGELLEGTHSSFLAFLDGKLITHPRTARVLSSTTVDILCSEICPALGFETVERAIKQSKLPQVEEAFIAGTITEIMPVVQVDGQQIADGKPGTRTRRLQRAFQEYVEGLGRHKS